MLLDTDLKNHAASRINLPYFFKELQRNCFFTKKLLQLQYILKSFLAPFPKNCPNKVFWKPSTFQHPRWYTQLSQPNTQTLVVTFRCGRGAHTPRVAASEAAEFKGEDLWLPTWPTSNDNKTLWPSLAPFPWNQNMCVNFTKNVTKNVNKEIGQ